jgi:WD40 repeat protein
VWNTITGDELLTLEGHRNVVYAIAFNNPYGDKIITGSFGKSFVVKTKKKRRRRRRRTHELALALPLVLVAALCTCCC